MSNGRKRQFYYYKPVIMALLRNTVKWQNNGRILRFFVVKHKQFTQLSVIEPIEQRLLAFSTALSSVCVDDCTTQTLPCIKPLQKTAEINQKDQLTLVGRTHIYSLLIFLGIFYSLYLASISE